MNRNLPRNASPVLSEVSIGWDSGDPWGSGMSVLGAVCDLLSMLGAEDVIPDSAGYRRALGDDRTIADVLASDADGRYALSRSDVLALARRHRLDVQPSDVRGQHYPTIDGVSAGEWLDAMLGEDLADEDVSGDLLMLALAHRAGRVTTDDLRIAARILDRYLDMARAAGRDY